MRLSISQPAYAAWTGYFNRIANSDAHVVLDHVQFERHSFTNRNRILMAGRPAWLTVPVQTSDRGLDIPINELKVDNGRNWQRKHLESIRHAYGKTTGYTSVDAAFREAFDGPQTYLVPVVKALTDRLLDILGIVKPTRYSSELRLLETKSALVLEICRLVGADTYLSGPFGRNYLELCAFDDAGIAVEFHDYSDRPYDQGRSTFVPNLSVVDVMCRLGEDASSFVRTDVT